MNTKTLIRKLLGRSGKTMTRTNTTNNQNTNTTKRNQLLNILSDGRRHRMTVLEKRLNSPAHAIRGRLSELRTLQGVTITHRNGWVNLEN